MIPSFVSQYLLCIYLLWERMWVIVFLFFFTIYIQISIIPNNIMFFLSFLYEVILTLHVMGQKVMNMFLIDVFL